MNTSAYKRQRAEFKDLLYQQVARPGTAAGGVDALAPSGIQIGTGVRAAAVYRIAEQGALTATGNRYDLAIDGRGYFPVDLPSGEVAYTRAGSFQVSDQGELVTSEGYRLQPGITIPQGALDVVISRTGDVQVLLPNQVEPQVVGQIQLATFVNEAGLEAMGSSLLKETQSSGPPTLATAGDPSFGFLSQGFVEASNVNPVSEITALITAQRAYEMNSRVVKTADEMLATTSQLR